MLGGARVPPDSCVEKFRQVLPLLVRAGLALGPVNVREFRMRVECVGAFVFASMVINAGGFFRWSARAAALAIEHVNDIILRVRHLRLGEVGKQVLVSAVAVHDDNFLAAIASVVSCKSFNCSSTL